MTQPWTVIDHIETDEGRLELRRRGDRDFLITLGRVVLMNSLAHRSEAALGELAGAAMERQERPRVLVGGLGMGYTLKAVLDSLPAAGRVVVAELNPVVVDWCRGPLAPLTGGAVDDRRVEVEIADVTDVVRRSAQGSPERRFDAVLFDLYRGPHARTDALHDPLYGSRAIAQVRAALRRRGVFAIWGEAFDAAFVTRLRAAGFAVDVERPGRGGLRHVDFIAKLASSHRAGGGGTRAGQGRRPGPRAVAKRGGRRPRR